MTTMDTTGGLDHAEMLRLLRASPIARIAFTVDDQPYALPVNCACDEHGRVVFRTGDHSLLSGLAGQQVGVEVDGYDVTARAGWCVLVLGRASEMTAGGDRPCSGCADWTSCHGHRALGTAGSWSSHNRCRGDGSPTPAGPWRAGSPASRPHDRARRARLRQ